MTFAYPNQGTCSRMTKIELAPDHTIESVEVVGGCNGNLKGIASLLKGMKAEDRRGRRRLQRQPQGHRQSAQGDEGRGRHRPDGGRYLRAQAHQLPRPDRQEPEKGSGRHGKPVRQTAVPVPSGGGAAVFA